MDKNNFDCLFNRCGGEKQISKLVDYFYLEKMSIDHRFKERFDKVDKDRLIQQQKAFLAQLFGCPHVKYTGRDLIEVHRGLKITNAEFDAFILNWRFLIEDYIFDDNIVTAMLSQLKSLKPMIISEELKVSDQ